MKAAPIGDLRHGKIRFQKQKLRIGQPNRDQIFCGGGIGKSLEHLEKVAGTEGNVVGQLLDRNITVEIFLNIFAGLGQNSAVSAFFHTAVQRMACVGKHKK